MLFEQQFGTTKRQLFKWLAQFRHVVIEMLHLVNRYIRCCNL